MSWDKYAPIEGFENLDRFQGEVIDCIFESGTYGLQMKLYIRVDAVELPIDAEVQDSYALWYGLGQKASAGWSIVNDGANIWSQDDAANWMISSKYGKIVRQCMDLHAPMIDGEFPPTDKRAWIGLTAVWERTMENIRIRGQANEQESSVTLPIQILNAVSVPVPVSSNGSTMVAPPSLMAPSGNFGQHVSTAWGPNEEAWKKFLQTLIKGKSKEVATQAIIMDENCKRDSVLTRSAEDGTFWSWAEENDLVKEVDGIMV